MIMMVYYYLPFMVMPLYSSLEKMDVRLVEASLDLGASWSQTLRRIMLPLTKRGLKAGFFLVFIPSFGEFAIPELMGGDKLCSSAQWSPTTSLEMKRAPLAPHSPWSPRSCFWLAPSSYTGSLTV